MTTLVVGFHHPTRSPSQPIIRTGVMNHRIEVNDMSRNSPPLFPLPATDMTPGRVVALDGCRFVVCGVTRDPVGNGTAAAPRPRIVAALEWMGDGQDPGAEFRALTSGRSLTGFWMVERQPVRPTIH